MEFLFNIAPFFQGGIDIIVALLAYRIWYLEKEFKREHRYNHNFAINTKNQLRKIELFLHKKFSFPGFFNNE